VLADPGTQTEALEILRGLIERVVLHPVDNGFEIELVGEIAAMVALGAQNKRAGPEGSAVYEAYRCSVKVVAGARIDLKLRDPSAYCERLLLAALFVTR
jgi:hypothetical protein